MAFRPPNSKPDDFSKFYGEGITGMRVDPNHSRFSPHVIDEAFAWDLVRNGQIQPGLYRRDSEDCPVLFVGNKRRLHVMYINDNLETFGLAEPMLFKAKYLPVTQAQAEELAVSENLERTDLDALSKAQLAQRYVLVHSKDVSWIAGRLRVTSMRVNQLLDLFALPSEVRDLIASGKLKEPAARKLKGLDEETIEEVIAAIQGGAKPNAVLAEIRDRHRSKGRQVPRTQREFLRELEERGDTLATNLIAYLKGDPTFPTLDAALENR
jgi:hypothetical protein